MDFTATRGTDPLTVTGEFSIEAENVEAAFAAARAGKDPDGVQLGFDLDLAWKTLRPSARALIISKILSRAEAAADAAAASAEATVSLEQKGKPA